MTTPQSLQALARWARARAEGLERMLQRPYQHVLDDLAFDEDDERVVQHLCATLGAGTMLQALDDPRADGILAGLARPGHVSVLLDGLHEALLEYAELELEDE